MFLNVSKNFHGFTLKTADSNKVPTQQINKTLKTLSGINVYNQSK